MWTPQLATVAAVAAIWAVWAAACTGTYTTGGGAAGDGGPAEDIYFRSAIQDDLEQKGCAAQGACHGGTDVPMHLLPAPATDQEWRENYAQVLSRMGEGGEIPLVAKPCGGGGHLALLDPADPVVARWIAWAEAGAPYEAASADAGQGGQPDAGTGPEEAITWTRDIGPLVDRLGCESCHGSQGHYSLASYADALGSGSDTVANVLPGDADSLLITYARDGHEGIRYADALTILRWIVDWDAREQ